MGILIDFFAKRAEMSAHEVRKGDVIRRRPEYWARPRPAKPRPRLSPAEEELRELAAKRRRFRRRERWRNCPWQVLPGGRET